MVQEIRTGVLITLPLILELTGLLFAVIIDPYIRKRHRTIMLLIIAADFSLIAQNVAGNILDVYVSNPPVRTWVAIYGYSVRPMILLLFLYIVTDRRKHRAAWALIAANAAIHLTALFSGICFRFDEGNNFQRGPLGYTCHIISAVLLVWLFYETMREFNKERRLDAWIPIVNAILIVIAVLLDTFVADQTYLVSYLTIAVVSSNVFYYIWLHLQFVREHEDALMAEQRIQIMVTQIQPHFLYNTLSTIQALCRIDPEKAFETTEKFGTYLRQNIDSLNQPDLIPITTELKHTRIYAEIEMLRFPRIRVEYEIWDEDFAVPALSVQPLVENAIRHGVRIRENGLVRIETRRLADCHQIVIRDNGKGFDPAALEEVEGSGESHIGIRNVRERIESMCGGTLLVESQIGIGTMVTVRIPVDRKN